MTDELDTATAVCRGLLFGLAVMVMVIPPPGPKVPNQSNEPPSAVLAAVPSPPAAIPARLAPRLAPRLASHQRAEFGLQRPSPDARDVADWVADSGDNAGADFILVDKRQARLFVFDAAARLRASSPVLLGLARGDDSVPGIGSRPVAEVKPEERTTPAGRFVAEPGRNASGEDVVWIDYDAAVSMHRVRDTDASERRLLRLATPTVDDNRISYGCINVPVWFYERHIRPLVTTQRVVVYVLPEVKPVQALFASTLVAGAQHGR